MKATPNVLFIGGPLHAQAQTMSDRQPEYYTRTFNGMGDPGSGVGVHTHHYTLFQMPYDPWLYVHDSLKLSQA